MSQKFEQIALERAFDRLQSFLTLPEVGHVLDMSKQDSDLSGLFSSLGLETARLDMHGSAHAEVEKISGVAGATGLPDASLDLVTCGGSLARECDRDMLFETMRILKPEGFLLLSSTAPVSLPGTVAALTQSLSAQFNPFWDERDEQANFSRTLRHLTMSGFLGAECHTLDVAISFNREDWVTYATSQPAINDAGLSLAELSDFKLVLHDYIKRDFGPQDFFVPFRVLFYLAFKAG